MESRESGPVIISRGSFAKHRRSDKHKDAALRHNLTPAGRSGPTSAHSGNVADASSSQSVLPPAILNKIATLSGEIETYQHEKDDWDLNSSANVLEDFTWDNEDFYDSMGRPVNFSAGTVNSRHDDQLWREAANYGVYEQLDSGNEQRQALHDEEQAEADDDLVTNYFPLTQDNFQGLEDQIDSEVLDHIVESQREIDHDHLWYPHGSKAMFILDLIDNLPRLRLSDDHLRLIIWAMKECGAQDVPSFYALRKRQEAMTKEAGVKTLEYQSPNGNIFYMNDVAPILVTSPVLQYTTKSTFL
ncbi:hypothetical protein BD410DRAFT_809899 [Rickenella mellea]|uniref:Uncharacterized protein n=1 Tax=Rickenella mellea TaxID=50990 RepID=A0A4Y7PFN2_9AGAM|nr:hypothetical protein BD410DRAFT_809899 [Rickenella mellea]